MLEEIVYMLRIRKCGHVCSPVYVRSCDNMALRVVWVAIEMLGCQARCPYKRAVLTRYWRQWGGLLLTRLSRRTTLHFTDPHARYQTAVRPMLPVVVESHKITSSTTNPLIPIR